MNGGMSSTRKHCRAPHAGAVGSAPPTRPIGPGSGRARGAVMLGLLLAGCSRHPSEVVPAGFTFGAAIAGFQVEMGCPTVPAEACEDRNSDWYHFITSTVTVGRASNMLSGDPPSFGPGYFELFAQDLDRARALGLDSIRFSIEWSRVFPESTVGVSGYEALRARASASALTFYHAQLAAMKARGLRPLVTVNHYTLPAWLHDAVGCNVNLATCSPRGWLEPYAPAEIAKYAGFLAREFGGEVDTWATLNEPMAVVIPGYVSPGQGRSNPPAATLALKEARTVIFNMIAAHAGMYDAIRAGDQVDADGDGRPARIGIVYNVQPAYPADPDNALDRRGAANLYYLYNEAMLNAVVGGVLDRNLDRHGVPDPSLAHRCDFIGLNYYSKIVIRGEEEATLPELSPLTTFNPLSAQQIGYPRGIYESIKTLNATYPGVPIIITENGADARGGDTSPYLLATLGWVKRALDEGADVEGYYWWTLTDNYEWNNGMNPKFGLFAVDPRDPAKARAARPVAAAYRQIAETRRLPTSTSAVPGTASP